MNPQLQLSELMLGILVLGVVFALARIAFVLQVQNRQPTLASVAVQVAAGGLLGLALSRFSLRLLRADNRRTRLLVYAGCFVASIAGLTYAVSLLSLSLL